MKTKTLKMTSYILALILICFIMPMPFASAYTKTGQKLSTSSKLTYIPHQNFGTETIFHFNEACWEWDYNSGYGLVYRDAILRHNTSNYPSNDGRNYIYRVLVGTNYVAQNTWYPYNNITTSSDIAINLYYSWSNEKSVGAYDVWSVFVHELGHTVGLGHSANSTAVMYAYVSTNTLKRYLTTDDTNGLRSIYA